MMWTCLGCSRLHLESTPACRHCGKKRAESLPHFYGALYREFKEVDGAVWFRSSTLNRGLVLLLLGLAVFAFLSWNHPHALLSSHLGQAVLGSQALFLLAFGAWYVFTLKLLKVDPGRGC